MQTNKVCCTKCLFLYSVPLWGLRLSPWASCIIHLPNLLNWRPLCIFHNRKCEALYENLKVVQMLFAPLAMFSRNMSMYYMIRKLIALKRDLTIEGEGLEFRLEVPMATSVPSLNCGFFFSRHASKRASCHSNLNLKFQAWKIFRNLKLLYRSSCQHHCLAFQKPFQSIKGFPLDHRGCESL